MATPIRKNELAALELIARGRLDASMVDELVLARLVSMGLAEERRGGKWEMTSRGTMELTRRKALQRGTPKR